MEREEYITLKAERDYLEDMYYFYQGISNE